MKSKFTRTLLGFFLLGAMGVFTESCSPADMPPPTTMPTDRYMASDWPPPIPTFTTQSVEA